MYVGQVERLALAGRNVLYGSVTGFALQLNKNSIDMISKYFILVIFIIHPPQHIQ